MSSIADSGRGVGQSREKKEKKDVRTVGIKKALEQMIRTVVVLLLVHVVETLRTLLPC